MSIFSRKSKSGQAQNANGKQNGNGYPRGYKNGYAATVQNGGIVDPIVQRMALQAESRKRMNSETPDYSIKSTQSGASTPTNGNGASSVPVVEYDRKVSGVPQDSALSRTASSDLYAAPIETTSTAKPPRETNKLRKSNGTMTSQMLQMPLSNGGDPDMQKMRMPAPEAGYPSPQRSRDSGYASVARTSTMESPAAQIDSNGPQDSELLRRHRQINASLTSPDDEASKGRLYSLPYTQSQTAESKPSSLPATPNTADTNKRDSRTYVSRLDPGPASSSFLSSPVVLPHVPRPKRKEVPTAQMPRSDESRDLQIMQTMSNESERPVSERSQRRASASSKQPNEFTQPTSDAIKPRESYYRRTKLEQQQQARLAYPTTDPSGSPPMQAALDSTNKRSQNTYMGESLMSGGIAQKLETRNTSRSIADARSDVVPTAEIMRGPAPEELSIPNTQPYSTQTTPYETPKESRTPHSGSPRTSSGSEPKAVEPGAQVDQSAKSVDYGKDRMTQKTPAVPLERMLEKMSQPQSASSKVPEPPAVVGRDINLDTSVPMQVSSAAPQTEFPYLNGIEQGATAPDVSVLDGYKVNRRGHILDEEGDIIGELTNGEVINCVRRKVNAQGEILDDSGEIVGHARPLSQGVLSPMAYSRHETSGSMVDFYNNSMRSPISPATPRNRTGSGSTYHTSQQSQQSNRIVERTPITATSESNAFVFELDASVESQAVPIIDHSEIFSPFGNPQSQRNSRSATSLTETSRKARRRQSNPTHTPSASQEQAIGETRRNSKRFTAPMPGTVQHGRQRSYSMVTKKAPNAVLGPTWESLLDTVPANKPVQGAEANESMAPPPQHPAVRSQAFYAVQPGDSHVVPNANQTKSRRASQNGVNPRASTHAPFAKSPLASVANTPPGSARGRPPPDDSFHNQLAATAGGMQAPSASNAISKDDDGDDEAAPAPIVMKRSAKSTKSGKSGVKRKSLFGIPIGRKEQVVIVQ